MSKRLTLADAKENTLEDLEFKLKAGYVVSDRIDDLRARLYLYYDVYMEKNLPVRAYTVETGHANTPSHFVTLKQALDEYEKIIERSAILLAMKAFNISTTGDH